MMRWIADGRRILLLLLVVVVMPLVGSGCVARRKVSTATATIPNRLMSPITIAVAPAINQSGSTDFDPNRIADRMASELGYASGTTVIPVSRVLGAMMARGEDRLEAPDQALEVSRAVGADAILVFSVTEYEPYDPPRIGISAQLYGTGIGPHVGGVDPVALSKSGRLPGSSSVMRRGRRRVLAEVQRVFDASHASVVADIKRYAALRDADESPFGWRRYVVSQQGFVQYCCYATIQELLDGQHGALP